LTDRHELAAALAAYQPETEADAVSLARVRELVATAADPFDRGVRDHVTAAAVIVASDASSVLLVHHRRLDRWLQPGGHVEPEDATVAAAAAREAREETGLAAMDAALGGQILDVDVHDIPAFPGRPPHVHHDVRYLFTADPSAPLAFDEDEVRDARWFGWEKVRALETDASLLRALAKARRRLFPPA
jgi:8-oxo-dGTP pyrophosphatase MutT (NUDIX family)